MRRVALAAGLLLLAACSERVVAVANDQVLIVVEDIDQGATPRRAEVHYLLARPAPLSDEAEDAGKLVSRMRYEAIFDCETGARGDHLHELVLADGQVISNATPRPAMERPSPGSIGESALKAVCDPAFRTSHVSRRPLSAIQKSYLEANGGG